MTRARTRLPLVVAFLLGAGPFARSGDSPPWSLLRAEVAPEDLAAANAALDRRRRAHRGELDAEEGGYAAQHLRLLEVAGARVTAEALAASLARGDVPFARALAAILADDRNPAIDEILLMLVTSADASLRAIAADGLGQPRARTPEREHDVVGALASLATDPVAEARWSALRSLFALPGAEAAVARIAWPDDPDPRAEGTRLHWHLRAGDRDDAVRDRAERSWRSGATLDVRLAAAHLLASRGLATAPATLVEIADTLDAPVPPGHDAPRRAWTDAAVERRAIGIAATIAWWRRVGGDGADDLDPTLAHEATRLLDRAVGWVAQPIEMASRDERPQPELRLVQWLPDIGPPIVAPVVRRLLADEFYEESTGVRLLLGLPRDTALDAVARLARHALAALPLRGALLSAATGAMVELGAIADRDLADRLLRDPDAAPWARSDILRVLERDPSPWVPELVESLLDEADETLRANLLRTLAQRTEPTARAIQIEAFFSNPFSFGHDRLAELVRPGDADALAVLRRALNDERHAVRRLALEQIRPRAKALITPEVLAIVRPAGDWVHTPAEVQAYLYALLVLDSDVAVAWVRSAWQRLASDSVRANALRLLQDARGEASVRAAVDLALAAHYEFPGRTEFDISVAAVLKGRFAHRSREVAAFWRELLDPTHPLRLTAASAIAHPDAPDLTDRLLPWLDALGDDDKDEQARHRVLEALAYQPFEKVESRLVEAALDPLLPPTTRDAAIVAMRDRLRPAARWRIMRWFGWPLPDDAEPATVADQAEGRGAMDDPAVHAGLAMAVGRGGGAPIARALLGALDAELDRWLSHQPPSSAGREERLAVARTLAESEDRINALARGIASTGDESAAIDLLSRVFDGRLGRVASRRLWDLRRLGAEGRGAPQMPRAGQVVALRGAYDLRLESGLPAPAGHILGQCKVLDDETLAANLRVVIERTRRNGGLATAPDAFLTMAICNLLDAPTHRKPAAAALLLEPLARIAPGAGGIRRIAIDAWMGVRTIARDFEAAARLERDTMHDLLHRQIEDEAGDALPWRRMHALALEGAAAAKAGRREEAEALWHAAEAIMPDSSTALNTIAWYRRETRTDLAEAERLVRRAMQLETRSDIVPTLSATDTLAMILLDTDRAEAAAALLGPRMGGADVDRSGIYHLHFAEIEAACGAWDTCHDSLIEALRRDPMSEATWRALPWHASGPHGLEVFESAAREAQRNTLDR